MWSGPVVVAHSGGEVQSADEIMIAGPPSVDALQRRVEQMTWCQAPGQPVTEGSGGFMNHGTASAPGPLLIGHEYRLAGRHLGSLPGREARLLLGGSELAGVTLETTHATFRVPVTATAGSTTLTIEAPGGAVSVPVELAVPRALAQATGATFVRGDPPVSGGQVFGGVADPASPGGQYAGEIVVEGWPGPDCGLELVPNNFYGGYMQTTAQAQRVGDRFFVTTRHVTQPTNVGLRMMNLAPGSDVSVYLYIVPRPAEPASLTLEHAAVVGGNEVDVTVTVDYPSAQSVLEVSSSDPSVVVAPATVAADRATVTFPVRTQRVDARDIVTITISGQDQTVSTELSVSPQPIRMAEVTIEPSPVLGGSVVEGTVRMTGMTSQTPPIDVALISDNKDVGVPATVKVTAGIGKFEVRTAAVSQPTKASIEARSQYGTAVGAFGIRPLEITSASVDPGTLRAGQSATLTIELPGAVQEDVPLELVFGDPAALAVQGRPLFRAGQSRIQVPLAASRAAKSGTVTIEILLPGQSRGAGRIVEVTIAG
jgi:hypothetical protein